MGKVVAGMASSHAYALVNPTGWEAMRQRTKANYKRRYGVEPPLDPKIAEETLEGNQERYSRVSAGFDFFREKLKEKKLDALILIGDDQDEHFTEQNVPQFAIYVGDGFFNTERSMGGGEKTWIQVCQSCRTCSKPSRWFRRPGFRHVVLQDFPQFGAHISCPRSNFEDDDARGRYSGDSYLCQCDPRACP